MVNRDTLLLSCGTREGRAELCAIFENSYNLLEAANLYQTKMFLNQNSGCIAAVIVDTTTFKESSLDTVTELTNRMRLPDIPILAITSSHSPDCHERLLELGATDIVVSPYSPKVLLRQLQTLLDLNLYKFHLEEFAKEQAYYFQRSNEAIMDTLSSIIEYRSLESGQHILRIRRFTEILLREVARSCPEYDLDEETIQIISSASSLHDIGKISIADSILNKPGPLTDEERLAMQAHSTVGYQILKSLSGSVNDEYLHYARLICLYHHERWDGHGYPKGIKGEEIPLCAQVVGLTDAYDALTSKRVYKDAYSLDQSVNMILNGECGVFSPKLLECFKQVTQEFAELAQEYSDGHKLTYDVPTLPQTPPADERGLDTLQLVQSKYQSLLHYMGLTVLEVNLDDSTYHIVYNPDPNLLILNMVTSFQHLTRMAMESLVIPEDAASFKDMICNQIPEFFRSGLRRQHHYFHIQGLNGNTRPLYRMTLLRIDPPDSSRRRMTIVLQQLNSLPCTSRTSNLDQDFLDLAVFGTLDTLFSVRRDSYLTLKRCSIDLLSLLGYTSNELQTKYQNHMIDLIHPNDRKRVMDSIDKQLESGVNFLVEFRILPKTGDYIWVLNKGRLFTEHQGHEYLYCLLVDISKSKAAEQVLQQTLERQAIILSQTENVIFECDMDGNNAYFSEKWNEMFGYDLSCSNIKDRINTDSHLHPDDIPLAVSTLRALQKDSSYADIDVRIAKADGRYLWCEARINVQRDQSGIPLKMVGVIINIDEKKRSVQALQNRAERDALTNLLNKDASKYYIESFLSSPNNQECSALLVIDLDNFKQVNDQYGHMFGDIIISQSAEEIRKLFRTDDVVGRIGGDEFIVLMKNIPSLDLLRDRLSSLISVFDTTLHDRVPEADLGCSVGVALYPQHGTTYNVLFRRADQALYQVKAKNKNSYHIYEAGGGSPSVSQRSSTANTPIDSDKKSAFTTDHLIQYTFQQLYTSGDIELTVNSMLNLVGQRLNVSRAYIFENNSDNTLCSNTFEWCNVGITAEIKNLQNLSYLTDLREYRQNFNDRGIFYCPDINALPKAQHDIFAPQGIKSMLQCAIYDSGTFRGFVGFDECNSNRLWTQQQIDALSFFSEIISTFLLKKRAQDETERRAENLFSILENQNAWIYVIDPDSFEILFVNKKTRSLSPRISPGQQCYRCLMGRESPCPACPAQGLALHDSREEIIVNSVLNLQVLTEATSIHWNGQNACLITCRELKSKDSTKVIREDIRHARHP